jgi:hypothetical protein
MASQQETPVVERRLTMNIVIPHSPAVDAKLSPFVGP